MSAAVATAPTPAQAEGDTVHVLVVKEHGVGGAAQAQPYIDKLIAVVARLNGWSAAAGKYLTSREAAETQIHTVDPHYAIMSLAAFLALGPKHRLEVIGQVEVTQGGGRQYSIISKNQSDLAGCKGKTLASDHADDPRFVDRVVGAGSFALSDFTLVETKRPVQTIKKVIAGEAECALVDDAQLAELGKIEGGSALKPVWQSAKLPPMVVVEFPSAPAAERKTFQNSFGKICAGEGKAVCAEAGLKEFKTASAADYAAVTSAYGK
ncbi:MAG TPA: PhnD/SsuA/transferrin family substrate-binding protein [Nannocystis sp.]